MAERNGPAGEPETQYGGTHGFAPPVTLDFSTPPAEGEGEEKPKGPDLSQRLDGDEIPDYLRGRTLGEALARLEGQREAIRHLSQQAPAAPVSPTQPEVPQQPTLPTITREQFAEMYEKDPIAAFEAYDQVRTANLMYAFEQRIAPLLNSNRSTAQDLIKQRYADEFEILGPEIQAMTAAVPKEALANLEAWDDLIAYARGKHWKKFQEGLAAKKPSTDPLTESLRLSEDQVSTMLPASPTRRPAQPGAGGRRRQLTDEQRENALQLGFVKSDGTVDVDEYIRWMPH